MSVFPSLQANARGVRPSCPTLMHMVFRDCNHDDTKAPVNVRRVSEESFDNLGEVFNDGHKEWGP